MLFGPVGGTIVASLASNVGAALVFLIARHLARGRVRAWVEGDARLDAIDRAIADGGWKVVALLRPPAVPFNVQNYVYGLTGIGFGPARWRAGPRCSRTLYVLIGHSPGPEAASNDGARARTPAEWALLVVGLLATVAVTMYLARVARDILRRTHSRDASRSPLDRNRVGFGLPPYAVGTLKPALREDARLKRRPAPFVHRRRDPFAKRTKAGGIYEHCCFSLPFVNLSGCPRVGASANVGRFPDPRHGYEAGVRRRDNFGDGIRVELSRTTL